MKLKMEESGIWKSCIGAISKLVEEANFEFGEDAVEMKATGPSHVAMVDFRLSREAFLEYQVEEPRGTRHRPHGDEQDHVPGEEERPALDVS